MTSHANVCLSSEEETGAGATVVPPTEGSPSAIDTNNLGVAFLDNGDIRDALTRFRSALEKPWGVLHTPSSRDTVLHRHNPVTRSLYDQQSVYTFPCSEGASSIGSDGFNSSPSSSSVNPSPVSVPFVHTQGIRLSPHPSAYSSDPLVNTSIVCAIIIFNLGLVCHLRGLEESPHQIQRLTKARALYNKSHVLISQCNVGLVATANPTIDVLAMALFNNMAQSSYELENFAECRSYFNALIRFAFSVTPAIYGPGNEHAGVLLDQYKSNFLLNAIILQPPKIAASA
jgi:hypothetical protein